jgi:hypothetical protein
MKRTFSLLAVMVLIIVVSHAPSEANLTGNWNVLAKVHVLTEPEGNCTYEGSASIVQDTSSHLSGPVSMQLTACEVVPGQKCFCPPVLSVAPPPPPPPQPLAPFNTDCTITGATLDCTMAGYFQSQATIASQILIEGAFEGKLLDTNFYGNWTATRPVAPVPAFSSWGLLLFALLLLGSAFWFARRKQTS